MTDKERTWLDNLKVGYDVIIVSVYMPAKFRKVYRTTPSQIIVKDCGAEYRYLKSNGRRIGPSSGWLVQPEVTK